jgi:hypothetical protein
MSPEEIRSALRAAKDLYNERCVAAHNDCIERLIALNVEYDATVASLTSDSIEQKENNV